MECPYCGSELMYKDYYGKMKYAEHYYIYPQSWIEKTGDIYQCRNSDGFEDEDERQEYITNNPEQDQGPDTVCESAGFNGFFYTDRSNDLFEGYPC